MEASSVVRSPSFVDPASDVPRADVRRSCHHGRHTYGSGAGRL
jgi:hypothetical protein